jgi:hypothetical protein
MAEPDVGRGREIIRRLIPGLGEVEKLRPRAQSCFGRGGEIVPEG